MPDLRDAFLAKFPVSRETVHRLDRYAALLVEWNAKFNLVAASTIEPLWQRHFLDSAQLLPHIDPTGKPVIADIGSGAGFPGLVLAIILADKAEVHLIESIGKKVRFLQTVAEELKLKSVIQHSRAEDLRKLQADIVTARAVTALPELLSLSKPLLKKTGFCLFLKGRQLEDELTAARQYWTFSAGTFPSLTANDSAIVKIEDLHIIRKIHKRGGHE